jgi:hypothetical protein
MVAKVHTTEPLGDDTGETACLLLVHIEIESVDRTTAIKPRLPYYYLHLLDRHQTPVLPIVVYLKVGLDGIGTDTVTFRTGPLTVLTMTYLYVGLPSLPAEEYVAGDNWLGVALSALMRVPPERVAWLGSEALRKLEEAELTEQQRYLLGECVHNYLSMEDEQRAEYQRMMSGVPTGRTEYMKKTLARHYYDEGLAIGRDEGKHVTALEFAESLLAAKFGALPAEALAKLRELTDDELKAVALRALTTPSLDQLGL